jgi:hypothetical protein
MKAGLWSRNGHRPRRTSVCRRIRSATPFAFILDREGRVVRKGIVNYGHSLDRMIQAAVDTRQKQVSRYADSTDESR